MNLTQNNPEPAPNQRPIEWVLCKAGFPLSLLNPSHLSPQKGTHMFVLSEIARKRHGQFSLNFNPSVTCEQCKGAVKSTAPASPALLEPKALPPALDQLAEKYRPKIIERVMTRLSEAERQEVNLHLKQDYRQAWITVSYAQRMSDAFVQASYAIYGKHPDKIWPSMVADRKVQLGAEYHDWYDSADLLRPDVPKIPPVRDVEPNDRLEALMNFTAERNKAI